MLFFFTETVFAQSINIQGPERPMKFTLYDTVKLVFIGDVMQHGVQIKKALKKGSNPRSPVSYSYKSTFKHVKKFFSKSNLTIANMEFPIGDFPFGAYPNFKAPVSIAIAAKASGIGLFQLANNHLGDQGDKGFDKTLSIYDTLGVPYIGAYLSEADKLNKEPLIFTINGIKIGFINFVYGSNLSIYEPHVLNIMDSTTVKRDIKRIKESGAEIIIALPHWGTEYMLMPSATQRRWAEMLFREGCNAIIGTHPHVPQLAEIYKSKTERDICDKLVFYSLGNFISNQSEPDYTQLELLVELPILRNVFTNKVLIGSPSINYLWCFKAGEYEQEYTVVPILDIINNPEKVIDKKQFNRMKQTYKYIQSKNLTKIIN